jgi:hypothetical protein
MRAAPLEALLDRFFPPERVERTHGYHVQLEALVNDGVAPNPRISIELTDVRGDTPNEWEMLAAVAAARTLLEAAAPGARLIRESDAGLIVHLTDEECAPGWGGQ